MFSEKGGQELKTYPIAKDLWGKYRVSADIPSGRIFCVIGDPGDVPAHTPKPDGVDVFIVNHWDVRDDLRYWYSPYCRCPFCDESSGPRWLTSDPFFRGIYETEKRLDRYLFSWHSDSDYRCGFEAGWNASLEAKSA